MSKDRVTSRTRRLGVTLGLTTALAVAQLVGGLAAHSMGLLSDAGHNVTDVAGVVMAMAALRFTLRPRDRSRSFGYHRGTILAALANAAVIAVVTAAIVVESAVRLAHPHAVHGRTVAIIAAVALVVNTLAAVAVRDHKDLNMRAVSLHMVGDALGSLAVLGAGAVLVARPSLEWADPAASLVVALIIVVEAYRLLRASVDVLLESAPADVDLDALSAAMYGVPGVAEVHDLHVWSLSNDVRALSAHVVLTGHPSLEEAQAVGDDVKAAIGAPFTIAHSTLELECERCSDAASDPCLMDVPAPSTTAETATR
ncbi:MAG TPA: cation diffusion facilitator family transporter [Acidimicrobiales bacterium]|nr:cation diffusion facilitator family transporter [Acidimicrobiales bacterium]